MWNNPLNLVRAAKNLMRSFERADVPKRECLHNDVADGGGVWRCDDGGHLKRIHNEVVQQTVFTRTKKKHAPEAVARELFSVLKNTAIVQCQTFQHATDETCQRWFAESLQELVVRYGFT